MLIKKLPFELSVCKLAPDAQADLSAPLCFYGRTDEEISLVCPTHDLPAHTIAREDGWRAFRIEGVLDFSLIGVLAGITAVLAENRIGVFVVSTYNTDYVLVKAHDFDRALELLASEGHTITE